MSALTLVFVLLFASQALAASAPSVDDTYATDVGTREAKLHAKINPEEAATTYQFQYVDAAHYQPLAVNPYEEGEAVPAFPSSIGSGSSDISVSREIEGLTPGTVYHYRVVATNAEGVNEGPDQTIRTIVPFSADTECPNQVFRFGAAAALPDCRAYEMVSPVDKNGASIFARGTAQFLDTSSDQAALGGDKMAYSSYKPFGDAQGSYYNNEYIATRGPEGWSSHGIDPPHEGSVNGFTFDGDFPPEFSAFSEDLSVGFLMDDAEPPLTPDALPEHYNAYLRDNLAETYTALTTQLFSEASVRDYPVLQGYSKDSSHTIFIAKAALTPNAVHNNETVQLYDYSGGALHLVSVLPGGEAVDAVAGAASGFITNLALELGNTTHAVSDDGSTIFWTTGYSSSFNGTIYARIDNTVTIPVSESVSNTDNAIYRTASADGSEVIFSVDENLYGFDVDTETPNLIAGEVSGFLGASDDLSYVYFVSKEDLAAGGTAGQPNLYLDHEGTMTLVARLSTADLGGEVLEYNIADPVPTEHFIRVTPDGRHIAFQSLRSLTGYDSTGANSGEPAVEVYTYDADTEQLTCVSCNPTGGRPNAGALRHPYEEDAFAPRLYTQSGHTIRAAAWLPTARRMTHVPRALSNDGTRLFFNSFDALVPQDANGAQDVYEWEAPESGTCSEEAPTYSEQDEGCLSLISGGESPQESEFVDASQGGRDVFIRTEGSLLPQDEGLIDIYDAREGGGLPQPLHVAACEGEACQNAPEAPNDPTPGSSSYNGPGNVSGAPVVAKKHRKKHHKRRHAHKRHRANHNRRASR